MPNLVLLGAALSNLAPKKSFVLEAIKNTVPKKVLEINQKAFAAGRAQGK
jgi:Pyruvate/2-oxoacid:ferredoxin oxidoreductase gamma subunit